jgi:hypothetical protein
VLQDFFAYYEVFVIIFMIEIGLLLNSICMAVVGLMKVEGWVELGLVKVVVMEGNKKNGCVSSVLRRLTWTFSVRELPFLLESVLSRRE